MFIIKMAKATPSGKAPHWRMAKVIATTPREKATWPRGVSQPDTGSVAMKKAAMTKAPAVRCCSGDKKRSLSNSHGSKLMAIVASKMVTGMRQ